MNVTLNKGGAHEQVVRLEDIQIPDLWHIAISRNREDRDRILEVWRLAHRLRDALLEYDRTTQEARSQPGAPSTPPVSPVDAVPSYELLLHVAASMMDNQPEYSEGCELKCIGWQYGTRTFRFKDSKGETFTIGPDALVAGLRLALAGKWPSDCTKLPENPLSQEDWENWLCQFDAGDSDAFVQLCCLGEVIYG